MPREDILSVQYVRVIAAHLDAMGVSVDQWLTRCGLSRADLSAPDFRLDYETFRLLILNGVQVAREPALGLHIGVRLGVEAHGVLGHAVMSSSSLREALAIIARYLTLRVALVTMEIEPRADIFHIRFLEQRPLGDVRPMFLEALISTLKAVIDDVSLGICAIQRVDFPFPRPPHAHVATSILRCPVRYDQPWTGIVLPRHIFDVPLKLSEPETFQLTEELCKRQLEAIESDRLWSDRVRRLLLSTNDKFPTQMAMAKRLHVSRRTLHRHLKREGTNYRAIVDSLRCGLATRLLTDGQTSVEEIAYTLGYSDPGNFRRAFKRWTGEPPSRYRARLRTQQSAPPSSA